MVWRTRLYELYIHPSSAGLLKESGGCAAGDSEEVRLICPMDILVRDQTWLNTFFDYSYTFEYFRKNRMKTPTGGLNAQYRIWPLFMERKIL